MDALKQMEVLWPSAGRAWELLHGANVEVHDSELAKLVGADSRRKRAAKDVLDMEDVQPAPHNLTSFPDVSTAESIPYFQAFSRWNADLAFPHHVANAHSDPSSYVPPDAAMMPSIPPYLSTPSNVNGRLNYWGEYHETFGDPAALTTSLYNHPLLAGPNGGSAAAMYVGSELSSFGNIPHSSQP